MPLQVIVPFRSHPDTTLPRLVLLNPLYFPFAKDGDIIRISQPPEVASQGPLVDQRTQATKKRAKEGFLFQYSIAAFEQLDPPRRNSLKVSSTFPSFAVFNLK